MCFGVPVVRRLCSEKVCNASDQAKKYQLMAPVEDALARLSRGRVGAGS